MLKLNDFINPELQEEGLALMRCLKNSLKRNIIFPSCKLKKSQAASECKFFITKTKQSSVITILLSIFPEALISAGGKRLISFTR